MNYPTTVTNILTGREIAQEWVELLCDADRNRLVPWQRKYFIVGSAPVETRNERLRAMGVTLKAKP